jgi:hypothetical protein
MSAPRLTKLSEDLWQVSSQVRQPGGVRMPVNMTVVRLSTGLVLVSPIALDDGLVAEIEALGTVRELVAPSCLHHLYLAEAHARWPEARVLVPPGLRTKRPTLHVDGELPGATPEGWRDALEVIVVGGAPKLGETVLFHRASGTLVCADLVFHVTRPPNAATRFVLWLVGAGGGRIAQSRAWRWFTADRSRTHADFERILAWPVRRLAFGHGEAYDAPDASALLEAALRGQVPATSTCPRPSPISRP